MKLNWLYCALICICFPSGFKEKLLHGNESETMQNGIYKQIKPARKAKVASSMFHHDGRPSWSVLERRLETAHMNTVKTSAYSTDLLLSPKSWSKDLHEKQQPTNMTADHAIFNLLDPFQPAQPFTVDTLNGPVKYPSELLPNNSNTPIIFHAFNKYSGFLESLWTEPSSVISLIANSPDNTRYVFMSMGDDPYSDAVWMRDQIKSGMLDLMDANEIKYSQTSDVFFRMHFVTVSVFALGNWIPALIYDWACKGHACGLYQAKFANTALSTSQPIILKRLDARYDWLPSPAAVFGDISVRVVLSNDGCSKDPNVTDAIAVVANGNCGFYDKMGFMQQSKALGVIVYTNSGQPVQDMNCEGDECDQQPPSIPGTMIPYSTQLIQMLRSGSVNVTFQVISTSIPYFAIDSQGLLAEMGLLLYPSFQFFVWQAEWFNYKTLLEANLSEKALVLPVVNASIMQGKTGIVSTVSIPKDFLMYKKVYLDVQLSCLGSHDFSCPPWDHVMSLSVCCDNTSALCGMELGRWITPFRRRIGRWLTNITPLLPLFSSNTCTFTMKLDAWWAAPWKPSFNIRFSDYNEKPGPTDMHPYKIRPLFQGGIFNKSYNSRYTPLNFTLPAEVTKVEIVAVITGHGSDEHGCAEFCVTSHYFVVNGNENVKTFSKAGTLLGCADGTPITGVEPNEYGTWLYGRNGWCNGREVDPWVIDITSQVSHDASNSVKYFGWYDGGDPDPKKRPGYISMTSYLVYYKPYGKEM